jgi:hypothetical protein
MTAPQPGSRADQRRRTEAPADDASLRAAIILGVTVSRHLVKSDDLAAAEPAPSVPGGAGKPARRLTGAAGHASQ